MRFFFHSVLILAVTASALADDPGPQAILRLSGEQTDPAQLDYAALPVLTGKHAVISPTDAALKFQLHNYVVWHKDQFFAMWSQGPPVEDEPTQHIRFATSRDGLTWSESKVLTRPSDDAHGTIARGLWLRDGDLLALVAHFKGKGAFGADKELKLLAFAWDDATGDWKPRGLVFENAINNFPPQKLPTGPWLMTRRDSRFNVSMLLGGQKSIDDWQSFPVVERQAIKGFSPDEPIWWLQEDGSLLALFRDNGGSGRLFRAESTDSGRTWTRPTITNFPNATSKIFSLQTTSGLRVLIGNANPQVGRRELYLALSEDGTMFTRLARLDIPSPRPATLQYPHAIEHEGQLLIAFSRNKAQSEVFQVPLAEIEALQR
jgi:hypothetical protein